MAISTVWNVVESAGMPFILVILRRHLHLNAAVTGVTYWMEGVGTLIGTVIFAMVSQWVPRNVGVVMGAIIGSALFGLSFFGGTGGEAVALILAMGMISAFYSLNIRTWRQEIVPHEIFGRVIAIFRMTARSTTPFTPLLGSLAIAQLGLPLFYLGIGVGGLIASTWVGW
ncbi:MAG: MFS transporter, partial [Sulfobacillus sp.]|nr:MFS transporter [Sulfobacillus sp.]